MKKIFFFTFLMLLFNSCSWQELFTISNNSESDIKIEYILDNTHSSFPIFEKKPTFYQTASSGDIDWNKQLYIMDKDTATNIVQVVLPKNYIMVFGHLSNDNYTRYNQYYINGRVFNLVKLKINFNGREIEITPERFDNYFKKKNGNISFRIK